MLDTLLRGKVLLFGFLFYIFLGFICNERVIVFLSICFNKEGIFLSYQRKPSKAKQGKPLLLREAECLSERCKEGARRSIFYGLML